MHGTHSRSLELETRLRPKPRPTESTGQRVVNLALQGGGSQGAFTWGVLDRLLEEKRLAIEGITATSAGAVNAVVLAHGLAVAGREGRGMRSGSSGKGCRRPHPTVSSSPH
jgi:predicted acylesterase/phospholipase RssA